MLLSPDVVKRYQEVGYAFLPQVIEPRWLALIEKGIQRNLDHPGRRLTKRAAGTSSATTAISR
jgi:hypothetical protein